MDEWMDGWMDGAPYIAYILPFIVHIKVHAVSSSLHDEFITGGFVHLVMCVVGCRLVVCFHTDDRPPSFLLNP